MRQQSISANEHNELFVSPKISVSDMHGRQSKVPVPSVIITFQRTQQSMAAVNTPRGNRDNVHLTHRTKCPLSSSLILLEVFSSVEVDQNHGVTANLS